MRRFLLKAALGWVLGCCLLPGTSSSFAQPAAHSVVLKPAASEAGASGILQAPRETRSVPARLDSLPRDRWLAMDKAKHLGGSFFITLGSQYVFEHKTALRRDPALALSLSTGSAIGLGKELYDRYLGPTRFFSVRDLVADALGLLLAAGVVLL